MGCACAEGAFLVGGRVGERCGLEVGRGFGFGLSTAANDRVVSIADLL